MNENNDEIEELRTNDEGVETSSNEIVDDLTKLTEQETQMPMLWESIVEDFNMRNSVWPHNCQGGEWDCECTDFTSELFISDDDDWQFDDSFAEGMV